MAITTLALGEEGDYSTTSAEPTTMATGEEEPEPTTMSLGEEEPEPTTASLGEEDDPKSYDGGVVNPFGTF